MSWRVYKTFDFPKLASWNTRLVAMNRCRGLHSLEGFDEVNRLVTYVPGDRLMLALVLEIDRRCVHSGDGAHGEGRGLRSQGMNELQLHRAVPGDTSPRQAA